MKQQKSAFTLVEILTATVIFSLFLGAVFLLYRGGTQMFHSGSWKFQKQKESERFLNTLKERLEQASYPVVIASDGKLTESVAVVGVNGGVYCYKTTGSVPTSRVLAFPVCKPALIDGTGLILYHIMRFIPCKTGKNLMTLELLATTDVSSGIGSTFMTPPSAYNFFEIAPDLNKFKAFPNAYHLGGAQQLHTIEEVASLSISLIEESGDRLLRLIVEYEHPTHTATHIKTTIAVPIEFSENLKVFEGAI